jgi:hypothetical protein
MSESGSNGPAVDPPGSPAAPEHTVAAPVAPTPPTASPVPRKLAFEPDSTRYTGRFIAAYAALGIVFAASVFGVLAFTIGNPTKKSSPAWSEWKPKSGSVASMTEQIANHVAPRYVSSEGGGQLVAVTSSGPFITNNNDKIALTALAIRKAPQSDVGIKVIYDTSKTRLYSLFGLGEGGAISGGTPSAQRGRLLRREALETALYTFKFVPSVDAIIAYMPAAPGATTLNVLYLEKDQLKEQLSQPLKKTLPLKTPPLPDDENLAEKATIDKLTLPNLFSYEYAAVPSGGAAMILDPVGS